MRTHVHGFDLQPGVNQMERLRRPPDGYKNFRKEHDNQWCHANLRLDNDYEDMTRYAIEVCENERPRSVRERFLSTRPAIIRLCLMSISSGPCCSSQRRTTLIDIIDNVRAKELVGWTQMKDAADQYAILEYSQTSKERFLNDDHSMHKFRPQLAVFTPQTDEAVEYIYETSSWRGSIRRCRGSSSLHASPARRRASVRSFGGRTTSRRSTRSGCTPSRWEAPGVSATPFTGWAFQSTAVSRTCTNTSW